MDSALGHLQGFQGHVKRRQHFPVSREFEEYFELSKFHLRGKGLTIIIIVVVFR